LSGTDDGTNDQPSALPAAITPSAKYILSVIGAAVSISGFLALVTTQSVRTWVKNHPYPIYLALIVAVLVIATTLNYAYNLRKRITRPSAHDRYFYATALERLPPNGSVIGWLRRTDITEASVNDFPADVIGALEWTVKFSLAQPVGFDDTRLAASFGFLTEAITSFRRSVDSWTFTAHSPRDTDAVMAKETVALARRLHDLVQAYDRFIRTAHARGIDIDG
jgi:hypothetical protein